MDVLKFTPLTIVGAGPAGIMAASTAAEAGVDVVLIDDNPLPGGQYYRQSPAEFSFENPLDATSGRKDGSFLLQKLSNPRIHLLTGTQVWGVFGEHTLALADQTQTSLIQSERIILATGAYDRPLAFPGWTLPGILGAGATLRMIKSHWVLPGKRILLAGLGPLQLALADALLKLGAHIVCVAEAANPFRHWDQIPKFWGHWDRLIEAYTYMHTLHEHKVPLLYDHAIIEASGNDSVEAVKIARLDQDGHPIPGTEKYFEADTVCLGYGLLPAFQLASALGCELRYDTHMKWYAPQHNQYMETTQPGIFVAGDVTDVSGSKVALVEGEVAGLSAAHQLGYVTPSQLRKQIAPAFSRLKRLNRLAGALQSIYAFPPGLGKLAKDDTLLCRCEEVTRAKVYEAIREGARDLHQVKLHTRSGMGYCQSRFCSVLIAPIIAEKTGQPLSDILPFTVRPPIQPIPLRVLASGAQVAVDK